MPTPHDITSFREDDPPPGSTPWVVPPQVERIEVVDPDPAWPAVFAQVAGTIRDAIGARALVVEHVGSTSVPGLAAKPVIDVDLVVADPADEAAWLPPLEQAGFVLTVREPWWQEHRCLRGADPRSNVHVFGPGAAEPWKHRVFRDHLRRDAADRELYASAKRGAALDATAQGEHVMQYNARKQDVVREIYGRAFRAAGFGPGQRVRE